LDAVHRESDILIKKRERFLLISIVNPRTPHQRGGGQSYTARRFLSQLSDKGRGNVKRERGRAYGRR